MNRKHVLLLSVCLVLMLLLTFGAMAQTEMTHIKIGYSTWVGYGPLFIAQDQGYFTDNGLDVEFVKVEDPKDRFVALLGNQLDGLVTTLDTASQYYNAESPFKAILGLDESSGGDGIVVNSGITSIADLKGKKIGVNVGSVSQFFLEYILKQNDMTDSDVELIKMKQGDVPAALAANQIDAGVTWEPHLSKSVDNGATLLASSKETPGLIVDILILRGDVLTGHPEIAEGMVKAWFAAVDYENANPDEGADIMAKGLGGFYETGNDIKADLAGATLFDAKRNAEFFGSTEDGSATTTLQFAIDFYTQLGIITTPVEAADMIDASFVAMPESEATSSANSSQTVSNGTYDLQVTNVEKKANAGPVVKANPGFSLVYVYFKTTDPMNDALDACGTLQDTSGKSWVPVVTGEGGSDNPGTKICIFPLPDDASGISFHAKGYPPISLGF